MKLNNRFIVVGALVTLSLLAVLFAIGNSWQPNSIPTDSLPSPLARYQHKLLQQLATKPIEAIPNYLSEQQLTQWQASPVRHIRLLSHWMWGNELLRKSEFEQAERYVQLAIQLIDSTTSDELKSKLYFDLSLAQIKQNDIEASARSFRQVEVLFSDYNGSHNDQFISYFMKRAFELSHQQSTSENLVLLWEDILRKAEAIQYEKLNDIYYYLGTAYWNARQFVKGINIKIKAIEHNLAIGDHEQVQFMMTDVGIDYLFNGNHQEAIKQFKNAIEYNQKSEQPNPERLHYVLIKLYAAYTEAGEIAKAQDTLLEAEKQLGKINPSKDVSHYQTYLYAMQADLKRRLGDGEEALALALLAKERHFGEFHARVYQFDVTLDMIFGDIYHVNQNIDAAIEFHKSAEKKIIERDLYYLDTVIQRKLYQDYLAKNQLLLALQYLEKENKQQVLLMQDTNDQYSQYVYSQFELKNKEKRIAELEYIKERSKMMMVFLAVILLCVIIFAWMLKSKNKKIIHLNALLMALSNTDGLTSIPNRRAFDEYLNVWNRPPMATKTRAIFMIDIDCFKKYNDFYGHAAGDAVIKSVATTIQNQCRHGDFVARYGGEEFVMLLNDASPAEALIVAESIQTAIQALGIAHARSTVNSHITLSIGVLTCERDASVPAQALLDLADKALYQAKHKGRNQYCHLIYQD